jgi:hypothetical protein
MTITGPSIQSTAFFWAGLRIEYDLLKAGVVIEFVVNAYI